MNERRRRREEKEKEKEKRERVKYIKQGVAKGDEVKMKRGREADEGKRTVKSL